MSPARPLRRRCRCPSAASVVITGRAPPPTPAGARLAQDAHPGGAPAAPRLRLSAAAVSCSPFISVAPMRGSPAGAGDQRAEKAARRAAELGCSSPAGSFCQATKSWPLSGSGLKFSREVEAGVCSPPCEMAGDGRRAKGCGFVAPNLSRRLCPLPKITRASTPSQALFLSLLGLEARGFALRESAKQIWHPPELKICLPGGRC